MTDEATRVSQGNQLRDATARLKEENRRQLLNAIPRLKEEQQRFDDLEAANGRTPGLLHEAPLYRAAVARLLPDLDPDPEQALRRWVDDLLTRARQALTDPDHLGVGNVIVEAAIEDLDSGLADLSSARRHDDYLRAAYPLASAIWRVTPYTAALPAAVERAAEVTVKQDQAQVARAARQVQPALTARDNAFQDAIDELLSNGKALVDLQPADVEKAIDKYLPPGKPMSYPTIARRLQAHKASKSPTQT